MEIHRITGIARWSPRRRGWTGEEPFLDLFQAVVPAQAGVDRPSRAARRP